MTEPTTLVDLLRAGEEQGDRSAHVVRTGLRRFSFTYREAVRAAEFVAAELTRAGVVRGDRILLWGPNSPEWVWSFFGVLAAGGVVVPADMRAARATVQAIARFSRVRLILKTDRKPSLALGIPEHSLENLFRRFLLLSPFPPTGSASRPGGAARLGQNLRPLLKPDDVAELLFTSGATGDPKGVVLTHRNILSNIANLERVIRVSPTWSFLSLLPLSHIFEQVVGCLVPWRAGASVTYVRTVTPAEIFAALAAERPTHLLVVPRILALFRDRILRELQRKHLAGIFRWLLRIAPRLSRATRRRLFFPVHHRFGGNLDFLVVGGAPLPTDLEEFWQALGVPLVQGYGLTETSPILTCNTPDEQRVDSVGRPLPGQELRVADDGEILARGPHVFGGYLDDPAKTAEAFTPDGWFRTGDLGALRDGWLYLRGRKKDVIVPAHGMNVYPEDIEKVLKLIPGVKDAAVLGKPVDQGGEEICAVLLREAGARPPAEIVADANRRLDTTQQITSWVEYPEEGFPRTPTLKVRKFLVRERILAREEARVPEAPGARRVGKLEALVALATGQPAEAITPAQILARDLKLDSLGRAELVALLESELNVDIAEGAITATTTVGDLLYLVATHARVQEPFRWRWPDLPFLKPLRGLLQAAVLVPLLRCIARLGVEGGEHLASLRGPVIFVANHLSHLDAPAILVALPPRFRRDLAVFTRAEAFENARGLERLLRTAGLAALNLFSRPLLLPQTRGFTASLARGGLVLDRGGSLLIFPEGTRGRGGPVQPFATGVAFAVQELLVPLVPVHVRGTFALMPPGERIRLSRLKRRGRVRVRFGAPLPPPLGNLPEATREIQRAVEALA